SYSTSLCTCVCAAKAHKELCGLKLDSGPEEQTGGKLIIL
ncbi:MAG: hypothetical protein ACI92C_000758, partial [Neolewinella sp.]